MKDPPFTLLHCFEWFFKAEYSERLFAKGMRQIWKQTPWSPSPITNSQQVTEVIGMVQLHICQQPLSYFHWHVHRRIHQHSSLITTQTRCHSSSILVSTSRLSRMHGLLFRNRSPTLPVDRVSELIASSGRADFEQGSWPASHRGRWLVRQCAPFPWRQSGESRVQPGLFGARLTTRLPLGSYKSREFAVFLAVCWSNFVQLLKMSGRGKGGKGLGKGGAKRHRKVLRDNIQGITKPAIRRLARRGGVKRISGLIYEETRGELSFVGKWSVSKYALQESSRSSSRTSSVTPSPTASTPRERLSLPWTSSTPWNAKEEPSTVSVDKLHLSTFSRIVLSQRSSLGPHTSLRDQGVR